MRPQDYSERTHYRPPAGWYARLNRSVGVLLTSLGLAPRAAVTLEVRGRGSGRRRRTPVLLTPFEGGRYLVSLAGESDWVRNVRAARGRARIRRWRAYLVRLIEIPVDERGPIIAAYLKHGSRPSGTASIKVARHYFGVGPDPDPRELREAADYYPTFRVVRSAGLGGGLPCNPSRTQRARSSTTGASP